jgi:hypothetical protein
MKIVTSIFFEDDVVGGGGVNSDKTEKVSNIIYRNHCDGYLYGVQIMDSRTLLSESTFCWEAAWEETTCGILVIRKDNIKIYLKDRL